MGLRPEDIERYTVREIEAMWNAYLWRQRQVASVFALQTFTNRAMMGDKDVTWEMVRDQFEAAMKLPPRENEQDE